MSSCIQAEAEQEQPLTATQAEILDRHFNSAYRFPLQTRPTEDRKEHGTVPSSLKAENSVPPLYSTPGVLFINAFGEQGISLREP
jgi:hypothetical protein